MSVKENKNWEREGEGEREETEGDGGEGAKYMTQQAHCFVQSTKKSSNWPWNMCHSKTESVINGRSGSKWGWG